MTEVVACPKCGHAVDVPEAPQRVRCPGCGVNLQREAADAEPGPRKPDTVSIVHEETSDLPAFPGSREGPRRAGSRGVPALHARMADDDEVLPRRLGHYELLEILGRGGMGLVYRARQVGLDRMVALKLIRVHVPREDDLRRFVVEAQVTGQLEHPNIVPVHEIGSDEKGRPYMVMKLVRGRSLGEILLDLRRGETKTRRAYPLERLLSIFCEVCQAVGFAHSKGVIHRDLKPGNVMIGDFGEVQLMDWGLARKVGPSETDTAGIVSIAPGRKLRIRADGETVRTIRDADLDPNLVAGTPEYMSPEQAAGEPEALHPRSDVYSLGACLFEILTFRPPHVDADTRMLMRKVATEAVEFPKHGGFRPRVDRALRAVALKALANNPQDRYSSALALMMDVRAYLEDKPVSARPDSILDRASRSLRRYGAVMATLAAAAVLISTIVAAASWSLKQAAQGREREKEQRLAEAVERQSAERQAREEAEKRAKAEEESRLALDAQRKAEAARIEKERSLNRALPHYVETLELLKRRQYDAALDRLQLVIEADPYSPVAAMAYFARGETFQAKAAQDEAKRVLCGEQAIQNFLAAHTSAQDLGKPGDARALIRCGDVAARTLHDALRALAFYRQAAQTEPESPFGIMGRAYAHVFAGREAKDAEKIRQEAQAALALVQRVIERGNFMWEAHYIAGSLYAGLELPRSGLDDPARALDHFRDALALEPNAPELWYGRALVFKRVGDAGAALADLSVYLRARPEHAEALLLRGELNLALERPKAALADLDRAAQAFPDRAAIQRSLAQARLATGQTLEAEVALSRALELEPDAGAWLARARVRLRLNRPAEAAADAAEALKAGAPAHEALPLRAEAHVLAGKFSEAAADYAALLQADPARGEARLGLAEVLCKAGKGGEALAAYRAFLEQHPDRHDIRLNLVKLLIEDPAAAWHDPAAAVDEARAAEEHGGGQDPKVLVALAEALAAGNKLREAFEIIERRAYARFPTDPHVLAAREKLRKRLEEPRPRP